MAQALSVKGQEQVEEWGVVRVKGWAEWEEVVLEQVPLGIVFALVVGQRFRMKWVFPATT
jgi:hypothetical protein